MKRIPGIPTDRSFGNTFAVVFALLGGWMLWYGNARGIAALCVAAAFGAIAATVPHILRPLNVAWMYFGLQLNRIISPIVLGAIFAIVFIPVAFVFRLTGRDALHRALDANCRSYWMDRTPPGPDGKSFPRQY